MIDVEPLISSELERMLPLPSGTRADWADVRQRAGFGRARNPVHLSRRSVLALVATVVVGLAIAVPASGLPHTIVNWFSAPAAPGPAQESFRSLDIGAPEGMAPGVSGPARSVMEAQVDGDNVHLWVAPTADGGFCLELEGYGGGCDRDRQLPVDPTIALHTLQTPMVTFGDVLSSQVDRVELRSANGQSVSIPVVYVSDPINASFFIYQLPGAGPPSCDEWPLTFESLRSDGSVISSKTVPGSFMLNMLGQPCR